MTQYFLKLHFDPDFAERRLAPKARNDGTVDQRDLGFVQNVVAGQVVAEWVEVPGDPKAFDPRFLSAEKNFPVGPGCRIDPSDPDKLLAAVNGYVILEKSRVVVNTTLTIDRDIDFHTGNIVFVGDVAIAGGVRSGFEVSGRNVTVKSVIEAGRVKAMGALVCEAGIKGGGRGSLHAGRSLRARFCERAELHAGKNILIDGGCMHSDVFVGEKLAVKGRLIGGEVFCGGSVYVGEQLGGGLRTSTLIQLGYPPDLMYADRVLTRRIKDVHSHLEGLRLAGSRSGEAANEAREMLAVVEKKLRIYGKQRRKLWERKVETSVFPSCRVIVPGKLGDNVEIGIGEAFMAPPEDVSNVVFRYEDGEIIMESPAVRR
jgi:uncharacterized protein